MPDPGSIAAPPSLVWKCAGRRLVLGPRTLVAGILNVTPDSFSDGGRHFNPDAAVERAIEMTRQGADIIDIGGESSRPGSQPVALDEERARVLPVLRRLRGLSDIPVSVDTTKAALAREALQAGADIVNDITALRGDPDMAAVVAEFGAGIVLMHMRGEPKTMQRDVHYEDVVGEVAAFLEERIAFALSAGIARESLCVDPGVGFGKKLEHNLALIAATPRFVAFGFPVYLGMSRKAFIGVLTGDPVESRLEGGIAAAAAAALLGAHVVRVHDVAETRKALAVADALRSAMDGARAFTQPIPKGST
jgi:dihydropteroate synthase